MVVLKHIAISLDNIPDWCRKSNASADECRSEYSRLLGELLKVQVKLNIPIFTIYLLPEIEKSKNDYMDFSDYTTYFFNGLLGNPLISSHKIKISIFGKWYNLPGKEVEALKNIIESTKDYDNFFANFCVNYDGQEEIVDACRLVAKQVELGKINADMITKETIKENIYSSYFMPPDLILVYGERKITGILLWDSVNSRIEFADKSFMEFEEKDFETFME